MTREEALASGVTPAETKHSMKRRSPWHDYSRKGTYMITLVVRDRMALLGTLTGRGDAPLGAADYPHVVPSVLGREIVGEELAKINRFYPEVEVWQFSLMPDHIHLIVRIREDMEKGKHLGVVVRGFKAGCSRAWWHLQGLPAKTAPGAKTPGTVVAKQEGALQGTPLQEGTLQEGALQRNPLQEGASVATTVPEVSTSGRSQGQPLFEPGYNDKILLHEGQLDNWRHYLADNPRRLLLKRQNPRLFTILSGMMVAGEECQAVGNRFLLDVPDKVAVIVHRRYTDADNERLRQEWLACGERGGVLVSAAIAQKEKAVMREAMNRGYRIILLREKGFPELYKPSGEAFDACVEGRLLQISPWQYTNERKVITRSQCLHLNTMAERIAEGRLLTQ